jgi:hypothetical protein
MGFKSVNSAKAEKYAGKFVLENDGDSAEVIFLYRNSDDMLVADAHYVKTNEYSGYVHCCEGGCPACAKGLRVQTKLFVPMFVLSINGQPVNEIQFWDRNMRFEPVLSQAIFKNFADPSLYVFCVTRKGVHGSKETTYDIVATAKNTVYPFDKIMSENGAVFPDYYEHICRDVDAPILSQWLATANASNVASNTSLPEYVATPRASVNVPTTNSLDVLVGVEDDFADTPFDVDDAGDVEFN